MMHYLNLPATFRNRRVSVIRELPVGEETVLFDASGPGTIKHVWMTDSMMTCEDKSFDENFGRDVIIRFYFDGAAIPQIECPYDDFFGLNWRVRFNRGEPEYCPIHSHYITHAPERSGFNCYFPMPYAESVRVTAHYEPAGKRNWWPHLYCQADIHEYKRTDFTEPLRFHARWRRENPCQEFGEHFLVADINAPGYLIGITACVHVRSKSDAWYHAGGDFIYLDGEGESTVLHGIGLEDFFGCSYGCKPFTGLYIGSPYVTNDWISFYRFFVKDIIHFKHSCRFMLGGIGNDYSAVAYWYQEGSAARYFNVPPTSLRGPQAELPLGTYDTGLGRTAEWEFMGPFKLDDPKDFDVDFGPEKDFYSHQGKTWEVDVFKHNLYQVWKRDYPAKTVQAIKYQSYHHFVDFNATPFRFFNGAICCARYTVAFARRRIDIPTNMRAIINLGFDDQAAIFLDGKKIFSGTHPDGFRNVAIPVELTKGKHELLAKLSNFDNTTWENWVFCCRIDGIDCQ